MCIPLSEELLCRRDVGIGMCQATNNLRGMNEEKELRGSGVLTK